MARKRKAKSGGQTTAEAETTDIFPDSEDEFYTNKDRILLDDGPVAKRRRKLEQEMAELQPSDEEVLRFDQPPDDDEDEEELDEQEDEEEEDLYWGASKSDYYNADAIETEADALEEEAEAQRLHQKQLKRMTDADFGFDELAWNHDAQAGETKTHSTEKLPPLNVPETATTQERMSLLRSRYPEFEPLAEDLLDLHHLNQDLITQTPKSKVIQTKIQASTAYMAAIAMYLALLTSSTDGIALPPSQLRIHPVMNALLRCRQLWEAVKDMEELPVGVLDHEISTKPQIETVPAPEQVSEKGVPKRPNQKIQKRPPSPSPSSDFDDLDDLTLLPTTLLSGSRKVTKPKATTIVDLLSATASAPSPNDDSASDFGDETPLSREEAAEKARKKKNLRFYVSQIAQKASKRGAKSREAGGDDDIPYKERIRDKQARMEREAAKTAAAQHNSAQDDFDSDGGSSHGIAREMNDDANEYYDSIAAKSTAKKADKLARAEAQALAAKQGATVYEQEVVGPDGKRRITYAIEKNKGLTPKRKKDVRNPRVKKKNQYEKKMKKFKSMRPTYKGGEGKGGYGGELTGIKTNLVKSVKL